MRVVRGSIERIEHPPIPRRGCLARAAQFFSEDVVRGKPFGDHGAADALAFEIDFGDEIDRALLLDVKARGAAGHLDLARLQHDLDGGRKKDRIRRGHSLAFCCWNSGAETRFTITTSMPPSAARRSTSSSMKLRIRKMPRPLDFNMFSGASGSGRASGSNPFPSSRTRIMMPDGRWVSIGVNST